MATFKSTTFGKISGKFGDALATQSKVTKKNYLRVASTPSNPRTDKQVAHRAKFAFINTVLRPFYPVFKDNFGGNQGIRYAINRAFKEAIVGEYPDFSIDLSVIVFSEGVTDRVAVPKMTKLADGKLKLEWDTTVMLNSKADDVINLVFYTEIENQTITLQPNATRETGTCTVSVPDHWKGSPLHCWIFLRKANGIGFSNSQYVDSLTL